MPAKQLEPILPEANNTCLAWYNINMPQVERIIRVKPGEAIIITAAPLIFMSPEQEENRQEVLQFAASSIQSKAGDLRHSLGRDVDDCEHLRTELGRDFAYLAPRLAEFGITRDQLSATLSFALSSANADPFLRRQVSHKWLKEFDSFLESLPRENGNIHHEAA